MNIHYLQNLCQIPRRLGMDKMCGGYEIVSTRLWEIFDDGLNKIYFQCFPVLVQNKKSNRSIIAGGGEGVRGREGGGGPHSAGAAAADQPHPHPGGRHRGLGQVRGPGQREPPAQLCSGGVRDGEVRDQFTVECGVRGVESVYINVIVSYWLLPLP